MKASIVELLLHLSEKIYEETSQQPTRVRMGAHIYHAVKRNMEEYFVRRVHAIPGGFQFNGLIVEQDGALPSETIVIERHSR